MSSSRRWRIDQIFIQYPHFMSQESLWEPFDTQNNLYSDCTLRCTESGESNPETYSVEVYFQMAPSQVRPG